MSVNKCDAFYKCKERKEKCTFWMNLPSPPDKKPFSLLH